MTNLKVENGPIPPIGTERPRQSRFAETSVSECINSLKICIASMAPFVGGAEVAAERLGIGLQNAGHDVVMILGRDAIVAEQMRQAGLRCVITPMYFTDKWHWLRYARARSGLRSIFQRERPDIIHSNDITTHQMVSDAARGLGAPRICHHRFAYEPTFTQWLMKFGAEHHLFVSQALTDEVSAQSTSWREASRAVVYDGLILPPEPSPAFRANARAELGLSTDKTIVTFAGQIIERKGVADLLHAWASLSAGIRDQAELVVVGDDLEGAGKYRESMQQLASELNISPRLAGFQKNVGVWLMASDLAVVPSHAEPLGNATLEAMSYALPVIGCNVGGIPEMIVPEVTGLLVPPRSYEDLGKALEKLLMDVELRRTWGKAGRMRCAEKFCLDVHVNNVMAEYRRAIARMSRTSSA